MRILLIILTLSFYNSIRGQEEIIVKNRLFGGVGNLFLEGNSRLFQLGYHRTFADKPFILGIENDIYFNRKQFNWPEVGKYRYQKLINITTASIGLQIARRTRFNPFIGLCVTHVSYNGKLITSDTLLKSYLVNTYNFESLNMFFLLKLNYRVSKKTGIYVSFNEIKLKKDLNAYLYFGFGLNYHLYSKK